MLIIIRNTVLFKLLQYIVTHIIIIITPGDCVDTTRIPANFRIIFSRLPFKQIAQTHTHTQNIHRMRGADCDVFNEPFDWRLIWNKKTKKN